MPEKRTRRVCGYCVAAMRSASIHRQRSQSRDNRKPPTRLCESRQSVPQQVKTSRPLHFLPYCRFSLLFFSYCQALSIVQFAILLLRRRFRCLRQALDLFLLQLFFLLPFNNTKTLIPDILFDASARHRLAGRSPLYNTTTAGQRRH